MKRSIVIKIDSVVDKIPKETIEKIFTDVNKNKNRNIFLNYKLDFE